MCQPTAINPPAALSWGVLHCKEAWWEPADWRLAMFVALVSSVCWGSWSNTAKDASARVNFAHFYMDFCIGTVLTAVIFEFTLGAGVFGRAYVDMSLCAYAAAGGALWGLSNLLLTIGVALAGLAIAIPLSVGTGLVGGTVLTYWVDRRGSPELIFAGVLLALFGVIANSHAYATLEASRRRGGGCCDSMDTEMVGRCPDAAPAAVCDSRTVVVPSAPSTAKSTGLCIMAGVLMTLWAPLAAKSKDGVQGLSPYFSLVCFTAAAFAVDVPILVAQQYGCLLIPSIDRPTSAREYLRLPPLLHGWGLLGGFIWAVGTVSNLISSRTLGSAVSYALGQTSPVVAAVWGLVRYREFKGAPREPVLALVAMFVSFSAAIALLSLGGS
mmetsp:Transcript_100718/g.289400  ORF Transcript_100718/g.289400 Transcript_100718/m.289400 type:complete len:383 (+) Transcript_100718:52-1200(+)